MPPDAPPEAQAVGDIDIIEALDCYGASQVEAENGCVLVEGATLSTETSSSGGGTSGPALLVVGDKQEAFGVHRVGQKIVRRAASHERRLRVREGVSH